MYLSKLEIIGFKSFASKTSVLFDSGISAIVGPNGCGKTNIVDSIRWVLGEQRYSALRSEKMEDVIFNGTKNRKALGMAEASLVIENTKGILPSEYTQVTISRRVYRSGESEYLLNKVPCRLKDILDLFMDTGMGPDAYSVIELKMVETILSDKTDERRRLFEEAAGVTKYKHRRKAAYRKLESVQADLVRVNDIVTEVQKAVNTLERQAKKAEQYNDIRARLKSLEIDVMEREYAQLHGRLTPLNEKLSLCAEDKYRIDVDLSREEAELESLRGGISEMEKRLAEAQRAVSASLERTHRVEEKNLVAAERVKALQDNIRRYENERTELNAELGSLEVLKVNLEQKILQLGVEERDLSAALESGRTDLHAFEGNLDEKKVEFQKLNDRTIQLVHEIAERNSEQERRKGRAENLHGRAAHAEEETTAYEREIDRLNTGIAELLAADRQLRKQYAEAELAVSATETRKKSLAGEIDRLKHKEVDIATEIERRQAKVDFLNGLIKSQDGLPDAVRYLASSERWKPVRMTSVADAVQVDERYRVALESALGEFASCIIVHSADEAEQAMNILRSEDRGKATFICLDRLPLVSSHVSVPKTQGVIGWAGSILKCEKEFVPLFRVLLDRVLIVENMDACAAVARRVVGVRCVTLEGEVRTGIGVRRGGSKKQDEGGMIGKQSQLDEIRQEISVLARSLDELRKFIADNVHAYESVDVKTQTDAAKAIEKEMNGVEMKIAQMQFEKKRAEEIITRNREDSGTLGEEVKHLEQEIAGASPLLSTLATEKTDVERRVGAATHEFDILEQEWSERSARVSALGIQMVTHKADLQTAHADLHRASENIEGTHATLARREMDIRASQDEIAGAQLVISDNDHILEGMRAELARLEAARSSVETETTTLRDTMHGLELKIKDERRHHDDSLKATHELELKIADIKAKIEHVRERAQSEFEIALELKTYPDTEFMDFASMREEIQSLREKIKTLGNINFAAFEEYTTEKERAEFLTAQRKDLLEAEKTLLETIEEINATAQRKFLDTFNQIRQNFIDTFKSLFDPGDECDLKLEEGVDPLEAKIEIVAKPRGKRPTSIDLLSGGEKTLTATALLFAIYLVKPSPFCILDEVDAPLDDANIDRFTRILRKFSDNTQFIVVTHNKRTMESANALYGVTMEEEGISKLVTVRFNQGSEVRSAELVSA